MSAVKTGRLAVVSSLVVVAVVALIMPGIFPPLQESYYDLGDGLRLKRIQTLGTTSFGEAGGVAWSPDAVRRGRLFATPADRHWQMANESHVSGAPSSGSPSGH